MHKAQSTFKKSESVAVSLKGQIDGYFDNIL